MIPCNNNDCFLIRKLKTLFTSFWSWTRENKWIFSAKLQPSQVAYVSHCGSYKIFIYKTKSLRENVCWCLRHLAAYRIIQLDYKLPRPKREILVHPGVALSFASFLFFFYFLSFFFFFYFSWSYFWLKTVKLIALQETSLLKQNTPQNTHTPHTHTHTHTHTHWVINLQSNSWM